MKEKSTALEKKELQKSVIEQIQKFQELGQIKLPPEYSPENAVRAAFLILQETKDKNEKLALDTCTKISIGSAMLKMVVQGLNPLKGQCSFVVFGNTLTLMREYHGTIALAKRVGGVKQVKGQVVYEEDEFEYSIDSATGRKTVVKHVQAMENVNNEKIRGAYAVAMLDDGSVDTEVMTISQIRQAWSMGATKGQSPAHLKFTDQMAIKTVASRLCKLYISTSSDSDLYDAEETDPVTRSREETIKGEQNAEPLTLEEGEEEAYEEQAKEEAPEEEPPEEEPKEAKTSPRTPSWAKKATQSKMFGSDES